MFGSERDFPTGSPTGLDHSLLDRKKEYLFKYIYVYIYREGEREREREREKERSWHPARQHDAPQNWAPLKSS